MGEQCGKLVTCERCGATIFLKTVGDGVTDGGFTRWNKFEPFPDGWESVHTLKTWIRICPDCLSEYKKIITAFMENKAVLKNGGGGQ
jgi:hypothetical protein